MFASKSRLSAAATTTRRLIQQYTHNQANSLKLSPASAAIPFNYRLVQKKSYFTSMVQMSEQQQEQSSSHRKPPTLTRETYQNLVKNAPDHLRTVIKFEAEWCKTCENVAPLLERAVSEVNALFEKDRLQYFVVDVEEDDEMASAFSVQSLPSIFTVHKDHLLEKIVATGQTDVSKLRILFLKAFVEKRDGEFVIDFGKNGKACLKYASQGDDPKHVVFSHVEAPPTVRGHQVGDALAEYAFLHARKEGWKVVPTCSWIVKKYLGNEKTKNRFKSVLVDK
uniref:N-acetyltransferase domain-containing protein n=1 Tax=Percolomonas cosmopolitus TaxID=63605 RepID=A0A7S1KN08_9EUKA|eukprot:CAMPEP_0117450436 /NCGR_PEP_ID=MMETSP0759-20121206/8467_1 /TAXON_ID=63605 /ORGANISM="Percolomonas cosmopolitus, Strain WS" /LENGTH=279 /DNA_ID=CAMNT_0005242957 /DNA_START=8 /DNA_END=847 /DNA_ORIENTATION=+